MVMGGWYGSFDNFALAITGFAILGLMMPLLLFRNRRRPVIRFAMSVLGSIAVLLLLGAFASFSLHMVYEGNFLALFLSNVFGGLVYIFETGAEFVPLGFLMVLISALITLIIDCRKLGDNR